MASMIPGKTISARLSQLFLEIFNRTGGLIYSSKENGRAWDGS